MAMAFAYSSLREVLQMTSTSPIKTPLKVKVVAIAPSTDAEDEALKFSVTDGQTATKAFCHNKDLRSKIVQGKSLLLTNFSIYNRSIILRATARIGLTKKIEVPQNIEKMADELINVPRTPISPIKDVLAAKDKCTFSVQGIVTQLEPATTTEVFGNTVPIRNVTLMDDTGNLSVALWRSFSTTPITEGQQLKLINASTSTFNGVRVANTNSKSTVEVTAATEQTKNVFLLAVEDETHDHVHLLCAHNDETSTLKLAKDALNAAFLVESIDEILEMLPVSVKVTTLGVEVINLEIIE